MSVHFEAPGEYIRRVLMGDGDTPSECVGTPYIWAAGTPASQWPSPDGYDCSGFVQAALVRIGRLDPSEPDRASQTLYDLSVSLNLGEQEPGDLAFFGSSSTGIYHVVMVAEYAEDSGYSAVVGANGGDSTTTTPTEGAEVQDEAASYCQGRSDFLGYKRCHYDISTGHMRALVALLLAQKGFTSADGGYEQMDAFLSTVGGDVTALLGSSDEWLDAHLAGNSRYGGVWGDPSSWTDLTAAWLSAAYDTVSSAASDAVGWVEELASSAQETLGL